MNSLAVLSTWFVHQLEIGTEAKISAAPQYKGFLKNQGKILNISTTPEVLFTTDLIYLRYAAAFALNKASREQMAGIRAAFNDLSVRTDSIKSVVEYSLQACARIFKLNRFYNAVFQGLGESIRIYELNNKTALNFDLFFRINFASALLAKTFTAALNPDKYLFLSSVCKITLENISRIKPFFAQLPGKTFDSMVAFLDLAEVFYRCMMLHIAIKLNSFEDRGLVKRTKDFKVNYLENKVLANELFKLVSELEKKNFKVTDQFNIDQNRTFAVGFLKKIAFEEAQA